MRRDRPRSRGGRRTMAHPGPSTVTVAVRTGGRKRCERSDPLVCTLRSVTVETLMTMFCSDIQPTCRPRGKR